MITKKPIQTTLALMILLLFTPACSALQPPPADPAAITGRIFCDCNQDGNCNQDELGLAGARVRLFVDHCGGTPHQTVTTDSQGYFSFPQIDPGEYCVVPDIDPVCGGFAGHLPTTSISRQFKAASGQSIEILWFGYTPSIKK